MARRPSQAVTDPSPRVAECRARVEEYKRVGVDPLVLEQAVYELQAAVAAAPVAGPPAVQAEPAEESQPAPAAVPSAVPTSEE